MRNPNLQKEEFSYAYVHAVASRAGFFCDRRTPDINSVDATIRSDHPLTQDSERFAEIDLQLKATSSMGFQNAQMSFPLGIKNYNDLRADRAAPILLIVLVLPPDVGDWLDHSEEQLVTRKCAYWCNLKGFPSTQNTESISVKVSQRNLLSPDSVETLMVRASKDNGSGVGYEI